MKSVPIIFLAGLVIFLGFSVSSLRKELTSAGEHAVFLEERNDLLQKELMRLNRTCSEKEQLLNEVKKSIAELESKVPVETLESHIPKKTWDEIKPIIDRLRAFREAGENSSALEKHEENF